MFERTVQKNKQINYFLPVLSIYLYCLNSHHKTVVVKLVLVMVESPILFTDTFSFLCNTGMILDHKKIIGLS